MGRDAADSIRRDGLAGYRLRLILRLRACATVYDTMGKDSDVGVLVRTNRLAAPHALREHRVDRARELFDSGIGGTASDIHATTIKRAGGAR